MNKCTSLIHCHQIVPTTFCLTYERKGIGMRRWALRIGCNLNNINKFENKLLFFRDIGNKQHVFYKLRFDRLQLDPFRYSRLLQKKVVHFW